MKSLNLSAGFDYMFEYENHRGEIAMRHARFKDAEFGEVKGYYPTPRLLFRMFDYEKQAERSFDPTKINFETWRMEDYSEA